MTRKEIDNLSFLEAFKIYLKNGQKATFDTPREEVKTFARNFLRKQKTKNNEQSR